MNFLSSQSADVQTKSTPAHCTCKICGTTALHSNFGAITCGACKIFFRRQAIKGQKKFKCHWNGDCEINRNTRHTCSACRLEKCFNNGMQIELIRASLSKNKASPSSDIVVSNILIPTLNLLREDQSILSCEQWNLISNLIHCYDEHGVFSKVQQFMSEQNALPIRFRYKLRDVTDMYKSLLGRIQVFENNRDTLVLCPEDQSTLIHSSVILTSAFGMIFVLQQTKILFDSVFRTSNVRLFGSNSLQFTDQTTYFYDSDITFLKLIMAALSFSTLNYPVFKNTIPKNLTDIKAVLRIQDAYIELAWKYMVYKHGFEHSVLRFNQLLRCLFAFQYAIIEGDVYQNCEPILDTVSDQMEQTFIVSNH